RRVVLRTRTLERVGEPHQLRLRLLRLRTLRADRGRRKRRHRCAQRKRECRKKACRENVRRLSRLTNNDPLAGDGTGAPGGAGTSRCGSVPTFPDERQRNVRETSSFLRKCTHSCALTVVRSRAVHGQASTRRRLVPYALVALAMLSVPAVGAARAAHRTAARPAALELYALDHSLAAAQARLAAIVRGESSLRRQRASLVRQLAAARRSSDVAQARLRRQLRLLYEQNDVAPLEVLLGSRTLDDAITRLDNLNSAAESNSAVLRQLAAARTRLLGARTALADREAALERAHAEAAATALARARSARAAYLASLAARRRLTARTIAAVVAQARAAQVRTTRLQPGPRSRTGTRLTVSTTGYSLGGRTSSGLPVGAGVAAVDPSVIPLGTHMTIPGYGEAVAADTGSSIKGNRLDLWFPTLARARAWGRRTVTITLH